MWLLKEIGSTEMNEESKIEKDSLNLDTVDLNKRDSVTKMVYASPLLAGLLFSKNSAAMSGPPIPPPPPPSFK